MMTTPEKPLLSTDEYQSMKKFLHHFAWNYLNLAHVDDESRVLAQLDRMERESPVRAEVALIRLTSECIEESSGWDQDKVATIDQELRSKGAFTLTEMRCRYMRERDHQIKDNVS